MQDLMIDGFMSKILNDFGQDVNASRDKVEICMDGTYKLLDANRLRYQQKRSSSSNDDSSAKRAKTEEKATEIIDILDDDDD